MKLRRSMSMAAAIAFAVAACGSTTSHPRTSGSTTTASSSTTTTASSSTTTSTTLPLAPEGWHRLPDAPMALGIYDVWTGREFIAGTQGCCGDLDGAAVAAYAPATNRWRSLTPFPLPARADAIAAWTGHEMVVTGGRQAEPPAHRDRSDAIPVATGAALDPSTNRWHAIAPMPAAMGAPRGAVWTGHEMVVFDSSHTFRYDPAADRWRTGAAPPIARDNATVVWSGKELLVWGGNSPSNFSDVRADGAAYNPATNTWRAIPTAPVPARTASAAVWTGHDMIVWGGTTATADVGRGAAYDPAKNTWRALPLSPLRARVGHQMLWTGREVLVWGGMVRSASGNAADLYPRDGAAYDPATNTWRMLAPAPPSPPAMSTADSAVWTGTTALFIGGSAQSLQEVGPLGLAYTPGH